MRVRWVLNTSLVAFLLVVFPILCVTALRAIVG